MPQKPKSSLLASVSSPDAKMSYVPVQDDSIQRQVPVAKVLPRAAADLRDLKPAHVVDTAATICAIGLIHPIAVDTRYRLVAGKHRLAAFQLLIGLKNATDMEARKKLLDHIVGIEGAAAKLEEPLGALDFEAFDEKHPGGVIPCRLMPFDSEKEPAKALAAEGTENIERENFTPAEVKKIAVRLKDFGYIDVKGRPSTGQKPLTPAVAMIVGKSLRQVQRMLAKTNDDAPPPAKASSPLPGLLKALERALPELKASRSPKLRSAAKHFMEGLEQLRGYLSEHTDLE